MWEFPSSKGALSKSSVLHPLGFSDCFRFVDAAAYLHVFAELWRSVAGFLELKAGCLLLNDQGT